MRVIAYVDAYNVYHGLNDKNLRSLLWLDFAAMFSDRMSVDRRLEVVRYFTSRGRGARQGDQRSDERQGVYIDALKAAGRVTIHDDGKFVSKKLDCPRCGRPFKRPQEKQTDVNLAVHLVADAYQDRFDEAWLMSADADLVPAVRHVKATFADKRVVVVPPRGRRSDELKDASDGEVLIGLALYRRNQLPDPVVDGGRRRYERPREWV